MTCPTGKTRHASAGTAKAAAHIFARKLNEGGVLAETIYGYRCQECRGGWHLTRRARWNGAANVLMCVAAPLALQQWAITGVFELPETDVRHSPV